MSSKPLVQTAPDVPGPESAAPAASSSVEFDSVETAGRAPALSRPLDLLLDRRIGAAEPAGILEAFLRSESPRQALRCLFGPLDELSVGEAVRALTCAIAAIDGLLNSQLNELLHHPLFQKLEASWRGLDYLVECAAREGDPNVKIKVLNCSWRELERDVEGALEFDQSQLFRKVYDEHFGTPGGEPLGLLIGDYEIHPTVSPEHPHDDVSVLAKIAEAAAAAFCPFVAAAAPALFEIDDFAELELVRDFERGFSSPKFLRWRTLRESDDARFVGLTLPRVLFRRPWPDDGSRVDNFRFVEDVSGSDSRKYLWGNAAYALGETVIRAFSQTGWLAAIRGVERGVDGGGLVCRLPAPSFDTDRAGIAPQGTTDTVITDARERELSELGFIPLCRCHDTELAAFYSCQSIQKPRKYDTAVATHNARISAMLEHMLCVSQFARCLKVIARDKVGSFQEAQDCQKYLDKWVKRYVTSVANPSPQDKARYPLREARVEVRPVPGRPGNFACTLHLVPHFELENMTASVVFRTELAPLAQA